MLKRLRDKQTARLKHSNFNLLSDSSITFSFLDPENVSRYGITKGTVHLQFWGSLIGRVNIRIIYVRIGNAQ